MRRSALIRAMRSEAGPPKGGARLDIDIDPFEFFLSGASG